MGKLLVVPLLPEMGKDGYWDVIRCTLEIGTPARVHSTKHASIIVVEVEINAVINTSLAKMLTKPHGRSISTHEALSRSGPQGLST